MGRDEQKIIEFLDDDDIVQVRTSLETNFDGEEVLRAFVVYDDRKGELSDHRMFSLIDRMWELSQERFSGALPVVSFVAESEEGRVEPAE